MDKLFDQHSRTQFIDELYQKHSTAPALYRHVRRENIRLLRFLIPEGSSVLDVGCGDGEVLAALKPGRALGIDVSTTIIEKARATYSGIDFRTENIEEPIELDETFDYILFNLSVGEMLDVWKAFRNVRKFCRPETRIIVTYYNAIWDPIVSLATLLGLRRRWLPQNWLSLYDMQSLLSLNGFETIQRDTRILCPVFLPFVSWFCNRILAPLPGFRHINFLTYCVARPTNLISEADAPQRSVSIIIPTRNECGNIKDAVERTPDFGSHTELLFVDGDSSDGTVEEIEKYIEEYKGRRDIKLIHQVPPNTTTEKRKMLKLGKGDAVRKGFAAATGDVLMILDSDLTVPPEDMPKFYYALAENHAEFVNGNRLSYPMENEAMRFLNLIANRTFGILFTWILGQKVKDTLCGTKVLTKEAYKKIADNRSEFGDFDPFGDFDLLFGAAKQNLKIIDLPVRYRARTYGEIKIERFKHGLLLLKMCGFALKRFKIQS